MKGVIQLKSTEKQKVFSEINILLKSQGFDYERTDFNRPWGGFFVIDEKQVVLFIKTYFPNFDVDSLVDNHKVSPKILIVTPRKRLSWQYHHRRSEIWRVVGGDVGIVNSNTDKEGEMKIYSAGDVIVLEKEERHRLVGLDGFGLVAEIWKHTYPDNPSDENDIVRLQDDFSRN